MSSSHAGAAYALSGPEALSQTERVQVLSRVLGREVRLVEQSREEARTALLLSPWMNARLADSLLDLLAASTGSRTGLVLPGVEDGLGRPGRTFAEWVADHRRDFE